MDYWNKQIDEYKPRQREILNNRYFVNTSIFSTECTIKNIMLQSYIYNNWIERYALRLTCKFLRDNIKQLNIHDLIIHRMKVIYKKDAKEIVRHLKCDKNSYISGSFMLQCIYGVAWNNSDIDIYRVGNADGYSGYKYYDTDCYLRNTIESRKGGKLSGPLISGDNQNGFTGKLIPMSTALDYEMLPLTSRMFETRHNIGSTRSTQRKRILPMNDCIINPQYSTDVLSFIEQYFDLEICKIAYSCKYKRLYIANLDAVMTQSFSTHTMTDAYYRSLFSERISQLQESKWDAMRQRVEEEGTGINSQIYTTDLGNTSMHRNRHYSCKELLQNRVDKYKSRGFKIRIDPRFKIFYIGNVNKLMYKYL
jgi:hypothetical protein